MPSPNLRGGLRFEAKRKVDATFEASTQEAKALLCGQGFHKIRLDMKFLSTVDIYLGSA